MLLVPISIGELIDKITILKIKQLKIKQNDEKLSNVKKEYELLYKILTDLNISEDDEYFIKLYNVNFIFWEYHDWQREKWKVSNDNLIDIELYRRNKEEHILNDKRAEIKKQINIKYNSNIVEEKQFLSYNI